MDALSAAGLYHVRYYSNPLALARLFQARVTAMTIYGINPSFCGPNSRLPLFANPALRAKRFEVFSGPSQPTGEPSVVDERGFPINDGRRHGLRLFLDMEGTVPALVSQPDGLEFHTNRNICFVSWVGPCPVKALAELCLENAVGYWHRPSLEALHSLRPRVLRTLDWQMTNHHPGVGNPAGPNDLQGSDAGMHLDAQIAVANLLDCHLWWCAPVRRLDEDLTAYIEGLSVALTKIASRCKKPPVLEYGNELWNSSFWAHNILEERASQIGRAWIDEAAAEIDSLFCAALEVFRSRQRFHVFVGGFIQHPATLGEILSKLSFVPDLAGPAAYVGPLRAHREEWNATDAVPGQDELRSSCLGRLEEVCRLLAQHRDLLPEGCRLACYEAGFQSLCGPRPWRKAVIEAHQTEWMGDLFRRIRAAAESERVFALNWYSAATSQRGTPNVEPFGLLEGLGFPELPKARAARGD